MFGVDPNTHVDEMQKAEQVMLDSNWSAKITITGMYTPIMFLSFILQMPFVWTSHLSVASCPLLNLVLFSQCSHSSLVKLSAANCYVLLQCSARKA